MSVKRVLVIKNGIIEQIQSGDSMTAGELSLIETDSTSPSVPGLTISRTLTGSAISQGDAKDQSALSPSGVLTEYDSFLATPTANAGFSNFSLIAGFKENVQCFNDSTCASLYGFYSAPHSSGDGPITARCGLRVADITGGGVADNSYGVYVEQLTGNVTAYAVYTAGTTPSSFGGLVTCAGIKNSALTSGRIVYSTTAGLETDTSSLRWDGMLRVTTGIGINSASSSAMLSIASTTALSIDLSQTVDSYLEYRLINSFATRYSSFNFGEVYGTKQGTMYYFNSSYPSTGRYIANSLLFECLTVGGQLNFAYNTSGSMHVYGPASTLQLTMDTTGLTMHTNITMSSGNDIESAQLTATRIVYSATGAISPKLVDNANLTFDGTNLRTSVPYGEMYGDNISQSISVAATSTDYQVPAGLSAGNLNGFTFQNARELKCSVAGVYKVSWSMSVSCPSSNNQEVEGGVMLNGSENPRGTSHTEVGNSGSNRPGVVAGNLTITLAVNDLVSLCIENQTAIHDLQIQHANLVLHRIGN
jgi:hypothetical protein